VLRLLSAEYLATCCDGSGWYDKPPRTSTLRAVGWTEARQRSAGIARIHRGFVGLVAAPDDIESSQATINHSGKPRSLIEKVERETERGIIYYALASS